MTMYFSDETSCGFVWSTAVGAPCKTYIMVSLEVPFEPCHEKSCFCMGPISNPTADQHLLLQNSSLAPLLPK